ncbi:SpoIIE family protein phosphatase, partial [Kineococcus sp. T13]|uniref:SpoIIE family protein phosphatase n=1 Tax=Kineococcus vitellinus TaxID=2696565 RepID=UPI0014125FCF|nr:SpoIIE family protein phosphatase [Kineococcus vitellinus]
MGVRSSRGDHDGGPAEPGGQPGEQHDVHAGAVLESMLVGYLHVDARWRITYLNAEAERVVGRSRRELLGRDLWEAFPAARGSLFEDNYRHALAAGVDVVFDAHYPEPLDVWVQVRAAPQEGGLAVCFVDVTERQRALEARDRAARRLQRIADFSLALGQVQSIEDLVRTVAEDGLAELDCNGGAVAVVDPAPGPGAGGEPTLRSYLASSYGEDAQVTYGHLPLSAALPVAEAARTGRAVLVPDLGSCLAYSPEMHRVVEVTGSVAFASLPLRIGGQTLGVVTAGWEHPQAFETEQLVLLDTFAAQVAQTLQRLHARDAERAAAAGERAAATAARAAAAQQAALVDVARALAQTETETDVLGVVAGRGLSLLGASTPALCLLESTGTGVRTLTLEEVPTGVRTRLEHLPAGHPLPLVDCAVDGTAHFFTDLERATARFPAAGPVGASQGVQAQASVPLRAREQLLGSLSLGFPGTREWPQGDRDLLAALASLTAQALARITSHDAEAAASAQVARFSETLQRSLLTGPPEPEHLHIAVRYSPAATDAEVGGDWYDAFVTADGATSLVVGDVTGHDRFAAAAMGQLRNLLRGIGYAVGDPPAAVLTMLDHAAHDLAVDTTATLVLARVEQTPQQRRTGARLLRWSNAGHLPPLLVEPDGTVRFLEVPPDLMLGVDPGASRHDHEVLLAPGSTLLLYTDGLVERRRATLQAGLDWLRTTVTALSHLPVEELCDQLLARIGDQVEDDVALLAVRAHPEDGPRPGGGGRGSGG